MSLDQTTSFGPFTFEDSASMTTTQPFIATKDWDLPINIWNYTTSSNSLDHFLPSSDVPYSNSSAMLTLDITPDQSSHGENWLTWPGDTTHRTPPLVKHSMETLLRILKTWPRMLAKGFQSPPILHSTQSSSNALLQPMLSCLTIAKAWAEPSPDTSSVQTTIFREMRAIFQSYRSLDEHHLLSALQALTFYTTMLMYPCSTQLSLSLIDPAIFLCLQKVVAHVARTGLMLNEELENVRPSWEAWVHVTSKRRAVFSLYLLHWCYAVYHHLDSFACAQLGHMIAPAPKYMWQCTSSCEWEGLYEKWLGQWGGSPYMMSEFHGIRDGTGLDRRTEMWLEDADELGVMFFGIVGATDRGNEAWDFGRGIAVLE